MPRILPSKVCPKCGGPTRREPALLGALYICERCDRGDPMDTADPWLHGELKPPGEIKQTVPRWPYAPSDEPTKKEPLELSLAAPVTRAEKRERAT